MKSSVSQVVLALTPNVMVERLRQISDIDFNRRTLRNSVVISTKADRLIPLSYQKDFANQFGCKNKRTIEAPHFAALTHTSLIAEIIDSL